MTRRFFIDSRRLSRTLWRLLFFVLIFSQIGKSWAMSGSGSEAASFLDIPVGAAPAAMGSAYTARATDAYAPVWNPAGLAFADGVRVSATHVAYLAGIHYDYMGVAVPFHDSRGVGASVQYLGSGDLIEADEQGHITGSFSSVFAAYSLAYGQALTPRLSLGLTGKAITESIADASAKSYAGDLGLLFKYNDKISIAGVAANLGRDIKFVREGDPLPLSARVGAFAQLLPDVDASVETIYRRTGLLSLRTGLQVKYMDVLILRLGMDTSHVKGLSAVSLFTGGLGLHVFGQEFAYAWVPYGDLGNTHYVSLDFRFGAAPEKPKSGLLKVDDDEIHSTHPHHVKAPPSDYEMLDQLLSNSEKKSLQKETAPSIDKEQR